jgi:hypothetical protein
VVTLIAMHDLSVFCRISEGGPESKNGPEIRNLGPQILVAGARNPLNLEFAWTAA